MKCKICNQNNPVIFTSTILKKHNIEYFYCTNCGFLQTEEPYWLDEAYAESINASDTGYMQRNIDLSRKLTILLTLFFDKNSKYLDYAGGYGVYTRIMRDIGFDFYWDDKYTSNLFAKGFEYQQQDAIEAITTFESFEHFVNPIEEIEKLLAISKNVIFSTILLPKIIPKPEEWWYYGLDHGQHISFYSAKTLSFIAKKYGLYYASAGGLHIFSENSISDIKLKALKFSKFGLHKLLSKQLKSKTWDDYLAMSKNI